MKKAILSALALSLLVTPIALASGSSAPVGGAGAYPRDNGVAVTETMRCIVAFIHDNGTVFIKDGEDEPARALPYSKKTKFVAQDKKEFDGRKKLKVADLEVGRVLQVTVRPATGEIVKVKVLKKS